MITSRYMESFKRLKEQAPDSLRIMSNVLIIEKMAPEPEKKVGSLYIPTDVKGVKNTLDSDKPQFVHVLATGEGYIDDEGLAVPLTTQVGDIVLVGNVAVHWFSLFDIDNYESYSIGICLDTEVKLIYKGLDGHKRATAALNGRQV